MRLLLILSLLLCATLAHSETRKPIKYCPKVIEPRHLPCTLLSTQYTLAARSIILPESDDQRELARLRKEVAELRALVAELEQKLKDPE